MIIPGKVVFPLLLLACLPVHAQSPIINSVLIGGLANPIAPGAAVSISGANLGPTGSGVTCGSTGSNPVPVPTVCSGVSVLVNGAPTNTRTVQANSVTFIAPITLTGASATIQVTTQNGALQSNVATVSVAPTSPVIFTTLQAGATIGNFVDPNGFLYTAANPAPRGSVVLAMGAGFGVTNPSFTPGPPVPASPPYNVVATVTVTVGSENATVNSATLRPGSNNGTYQVSFVVPSTLSNGSYPVVIKAGGVSSQTLQLSVGPAAGGPAISSILDLAGGARFSPGGGRQS